ncbi:hypothetical protein [Metapseudomonas otitidis]|uniref:hypothetical protein n=1 Tax=Metapseudomonas otitidis TaxID=319939 RepID=UPI001602B9DA|nr:hypothetical protein [Pseudomonas otitidis]
MEFLTIFSGLLTPIIAALGITIAYRQWRTAHDKLRLDLFEKRLEVYDAIDLFVRKSALKHTDKEELAIVFFEAMKKARWLFEPNLLHFCRSKVYKCAADIADIWEEHAETEDDEVKAQLIGKIVDKKRQLFALRRELIDVFSPYMAIRTK